MVDSSWIVAMVDSSRVVAVVDLSWVVAMADSSRVVAMVDLSQVVELVDSSQVVAISLVAVDVSLTLFGAIACIVRSSSRHAIGKP